MTAPVPVLVKVKVRGLLVPAVTFPKLKLMLLAVSVPVLEPEGEPDFAAGVPAPVKPKQPVIESTAKHARMSANMPSGAGRLRFT